MTSMFDVIVIGAGLSGLTCAERLLASNSSLNVLVLEGSDRVGGRTKTVEVSLKGSDKRVKMDAGGMWLGPTQRRMLANCERFGLETVQQYFFEGEHVLAQGDASTRKVYKGDIPPYSILSLLEIQVTLIYRLDAMAKTVPLDDPWKCPNAKEYDSHSVASYLVSGLWTKGARQVVDLICWALLGAQASQVSMLFFLWLIHSCEGVRMLTDATGGAQDRTIKGGSQQVSEKLMQAVESLGGQVLFGKYVTEIVGDSDSAASKETSKVVVVCKDGSRYTSRTVVSAGLASKFIRDCTFSPPLPGAIERFGSMTFRGAYAKAVLVYDQAWWRTKGFSGFVTNTEPSKERCACFGYDYGIGNSIVIFIAADVSVEVGALPENERRDSVLNSLRFFFPDQASLVDSYLSYHDEFWQYDEFANGAPMTVYPPGSFEDYSTMRTLRNPLKVGNSSTPSLFFAGTDVSPVWCGYMEGACARGEQVADQVLAVLSSKSSSEHQSRTPDDELRWESVPI